MNRFVQPPMARHLIGFLLIISAGLLAYYPGLTDFMLADDYPNIILNPDIRLNGLGYDDLVSAANANDSGPLKRPLASLSFGLNYYFSGQQIIPSHFKMTNLVIHLFNGILVYLIVLRMAAILRGKNSNLFPSQWLALCVALVWVLQPVQLTSVLYSVQRMNSMSALFVLAGLLIFLNGRCRLAGGLPYAQTLMYGGILAGTLLGSLNKENALLLPFLALAVELTLFNRKDLSIQAQKECKRFYLITVAVPVIAGTIFLILYPGIILNGYAARNFTLYERLMTEARVIFYYLRLIMYPDLSQLALYHDDISISRTLLSPWTTLSSILATVALLGAALTYRKRVRVFSFMVLWFFIGHVMESTIFSLEIAYEHRNYLPSFGVIFGAMYYLITALRYLTAKKFFRLAPPLVIILSLLMTTHTRAAIWSEEKMVGHFDVRNHPESAKSRVMYAGSLMQSAGDPLLIYDNLRIAAKLDTFELPAIISQLMALKAIELNLEEFTGSTVKADNKIQAPEYYHDPLKLDPEYIAAIKDLINQQITQRLKDTVNHTRAALALREVSGCITQGHIHCADMSTHAINWFKLALNTPNMDQKHKAIIHLSYAKILAHNGNLEIALQHIDKSIKLQPSDLYITMEKIELYISFAQWEEAASLIDSLAQNKDMHTHHKRVLAKIKADYRTAYENTTGTPSL